MAEWNETIEEWEFAKGEDAWFVPGHYPTNLFIVRVAILEVVEDYRQLYGVYGGLRYVIDEPCYEPIEGDDLFPSKDLAMVELNRRVAHHNEAIRGKHVTQNRRIKYENDPHLQNQYPDLDVARIKVKEQMRSRYRVDYPKSQGALPSSLTRTPTKIFGIDWFRSEVPPKKVI